MTESPYFRKRRQIINGGESDSPYFRKAPSSPFGAVQSMGSLLTCLGRCVEPCSHQAATFCSHVDADLNNNHVSDRVRHAIRHFEDCPIFQKAWVEASFTYMGKHDEDDDERRLTTSVRHLCRHRCYYHAYAPARAWLALRETLQSETSLPIQPLLYGWSCALLPCCNNTPKVAFLDPFHQIMWSEKDVIHRILGAPSQKKRGVVLKKSLTIRQCSLFDPEPTNECILIHKKSKLSHPTEQIISITDSPLGLLEELFVDDPFQLLLSTIFLNRTTRIQVDHILCEFLEQWSTPEAILGAELNHLVTILRPMGMCHRRAAGIQQFTRDYLETTRHTDARHFSYRDFKELFYCGRYARDAYRLFIQRNGSIEPLDHALRAYVRYQRGLH